MKADAQSELPSRLEIVVSTTPGKPGAPTETVRISRNGQDGVVKVERTSSDAAPEEGSAPLSLDDLRAVWKTVVKNKLHSFRPEEKAGQVFDFGERRLQIASGESADGPVSQLDVSWNAPILNQDAVESLLQQTFRLAQQRVRNVTLSYTGIQK